MNTLLDLYADFLQVTFGSATATGLSEMVDGQVSHDQVTRLLSSKSWDSRDLWLTVKKLVRAHESEDACLIFDDTVIEKPHTDESELVCWHFDHSKNRLVKGINFLSTFYHSQRTGDPVPLRIPIGFEPILKPVCFLDEKTGQTKRKSEITKNELLRNQFKQCLTNQVLFRYVLADSWFASNDNMRFIHKKKKIFIFDMKNNRMAATSDEDRNRGYWRRIDQLNLQPNTPVQVWLKDLNIPVLLVKHVFTNKDASTGERYLVSNDLELDNDRFETLYQKRWSVEEYHKSLKQNTAAAKSPTRTTRTQNNHLFASILAYTKLEKIKFASSMNHFAIKSKLYMVAIKAAFKELKKLKNQLELQPTA